jgi:DNA-binding SARP family transcriptional activator
MDTEIIASKDEPISRRPAQYQAHWQKVCELLEVGQYRRVAEFLLQTQGATEETDNATVTDILVAAHQICLACEQSQTEAEWHQQAHAEATKRERRLRKRLHDILDLVIRNGMPGVEEEPALPVFAPTAEMGLPDRGTPRSRKRHSLWQRIQSLLGVGSGRPSSDGKTLEDSSEGLILPLAEEAEVLLDPPTNEAEVSVVSPIGERVQEVQGSPALAVYCLGPFRVYQDDELITDWPSGKGKAIFKYMTADGGRPILKDVLMSLFWPDADPEAARNNLNVAIYGLRQAFRVGRPDFPHILFEDDCYVLNRVMAVWIDVEEFLQRYDAGRNLERQGKLVEAVSEYEAAEGLYQGDFLEEDPYEDWPIPRREGLKDSYLFILDRLSRYYLRQKAYSMCIQLCQKILAKDDCREDAHRRLMRSYYQQGQRNLALRQYHLCVEFLAQVLDVPPMPETLTLYRHIRNGETSRVNSFE